MKRSPIYVEIDIRTEMDKLWEVTQNPALHEQWDVRFSSITYLPHKDDEPQEFSYKTKVGPIKVEGWGRSVGTFHAKNGSRTSSLHFGTDSKISIIKEGKGYWKYEPSKQENIKFYTQYDYETQFGRFGEFVDRIFFRPLISWGTALSFDVVKRWVEAGESPASQYIRFFINWLIAIFFFFIWCYHGSVPKLLFQHPDEVTMITNTIPLSFQAASTIVFVAGIAEIIFGVMWLIVLRKKLLYRLQVIVFPLLMFTATIADPTYLQQPFNPLTLNVSLFVLSVIGLMISEDIPTAKSCKRKRT